MAVLAIYLTIAAAIAGSIYALARNKGYPPLPNGIAAGFTTLFFIVPGLIYLVVMACLPPKHYYCPKCGTRNIFFLTNCSSCKSPLDHPIY